MQRNLLLIGTLLLCLSATVLLPARIPAAAAERVLAGDEGPAVGLKSAIELAEEYAKGERIDLSKHYLMSARLISKTDSPGKRAWEIVWDGTQKANDDEIEFIVEMDKTVTRRPRG